ncbi:MAG: hypothetical protein ACYTGR_17380 [Planctomycetota bacterium]|jgi:glutamate dehydrogenase
MSAKIASNEPSVPADVSILIDEVSLGLRETAQEVVPWFVEQMPTMYFQDTDHETQVSHLRAIIAAKSSGRPIEQTLRSEDGSQWTSMRPLNYPGVLAELAAELPSDRKLRAAKIHTAKDGTLVLDTFEFGDMEAFDASDPVQAAKAEECLAYAAEHAPHLTPEMLNDLFPRLRAEQLQTITPLRFCRQAERYQVLTGTDGTLIDLEPESDPTQCRITVSYGNATTQVMLARIASRLARSMINIHRAYLDSVDDGRNGTISILGFVVTGPDGGVIDGDSQLWHQLRQDLLRARGPRDHARRDHHRVLRPGPPGADQGEPLRLQPRPHPVAGQGEHRLHAGNRRSVPRPVRPRHAYDDQPVRAASR